MTLEYYRIVQKTKIKHEKLSKYEIDPVTRKIINKATGMPMSYRIKRSKKKDGTFREEYYCTVRDDDRKQRSILVARAILSTLVGPPPTPKHTADHIDRDSTNNALDNLRWATKKEQNDNQDRPTTQNNALIIVKDGVEKTAKEWAKELNLHPITILGYARNEINGFAYKVYSDLPGEIGKKVEGSENSRGRWEITNMMRARYFWKWVDKSTGEIKEHSKVYDKFVEQAGYPSIGINGNQEYLHYVVFRAFKPDKYQQLLANPELIIRHLDDNRYNFTPENLDLGTRPQNGHDAHNNGKHDGTKSARKPVASYKDGVFEQEHKSINEAVRYLQENDHPKANRRNIQAGIKTERIRYGRTWKFVT